MKDIVSPVQAMRDQLPQKIELDSLKLLKPIKERKEQERTNMN